MFSLRINLSQGIRLSRRIFNKRLLSSYNAVNESIGEYKQGSEELSKLEEKLKEFESTKQKIPVIVGDSEFHTDEVCHQVEPFNHKKVISEFSYSTKSQLENAIEASQAAHPSWASVSLEERSKIFLRAADLVSGKYRYDVLASTILGQGKTVLQAEIDAVCELADFYRFNVDFALKSCSYQPISTNISKNAFNLRPLEGFWAAISPFNFTAIGGNLCGAPALMGNVVLWKPSDTAMLSSYIVYKILREAGLPSGVINFLPSDGPLFGDVVTNSSLLAGINFTGSAKTFQHLWQLVGKNIHQYKNFPRLIGECGGKNFHFIHHTADIDSVVNGTIRSAFEYGGQKCSACSRMYVPSSKWPEIKEKLVKEHSKIKFGTPLDYSNFLSAVIDENSFKRVDSYLKYAHSNLKIVAGGKSDNSLGFFIEPTIVEVDNPQDKIMQEEIFGPVLSVYAYPDDKYLDILKQINSTSPYGLTGSIYSKEDRIISEARDILRFAAGNVYLNDKSTGSVVGQQPFGGSRKSGTNDKAGGPHYILRFCSPQSVKETSEPLTNWQYT